MSKDLVVPEKLGLKARSIDLGGYIQGFAQIFEGLKNWSIGIPLVLVFFALWELLPRLGLVDALILPTFSDTIKVLYDLIVSGKLLLHVLVSLQRTIAGFALSVLVGVPLGLLMGHYRQFEKISDILVQSLRNTSTFALMPIFLLVLGLGESSKIAIIFYGALWQILMNTISGVKSVDPIYIKAARSMGLSEKDLFIKVILPASFPSIVIGARLGAKIALMVVIAAEMIGAKSGLGFFIQNAQYNFLIPEMYAGILTMSILGLIINYLLVWLERKATYWKGDLSGSIH
ncbi:MAG: ABC transporter permease [Chlorobiaceae bacterium]|nr:ABC transporter permease [Chlorobiaceae bacterium]